MVGDGHWLGSLPGWYASICVKLFLLALSTLHFQFAYFHPNWNPAIQLATRPGTWPFKQPYFPVPKSRKTVRSSKVYGHEPNTRIDWIFERICKPWKYTLKLGIV